jgi:DNA ligase-1
MIKPMLAAKPEPEELDTILPLLRYPLLGSPKYDGIRASVQNGKLYSRSLKLIPNVAMQRLWGCEGLEGLDGEIIVGPPTALDCFNRSTSVVMSRSKPIIDAVFYVFDCPDDIEPFQIRLGNADYLVNGDGYKKRGWETVKVVQHKLLKTHKQLLDYETKETARGHEGIMLRDPNGAHKQGRSTMREGGLIAVKRFVDAEAVVLDTYEQEENTNEQVLSELGRMKRSSHKAGKVGKDTLGGFTVALLPRGGALTELKFNIGSGVGLTDAVRKELWAQRKSLVGKIVKLRYQKIGTMEKPRIPIFLGFRDLKDL